jgi:hypothetical protein
MEDGSSSDEREVRAARNQALFRAVNEKILEINESFGALNGSISVACECAQVDCVKVLEISADAYRAVRKNPRTFVVLADHIFPDVEIVLSRHAGYAVVEAIGRGAQVTEATFRPGRESLAGDG